jgi:activator of HSP90 ATPase
MSKTIRQTVTFKAGAHAIYEALMDSKKHAQFTGGAATISRKVGGEFSISDGDIEGKNLELEPDRKIVQSWRYSDWEKGVYSTATFFLEESNGKTKLTFTQSGVPDEHYEDIKQGWKDYYWAPMKEMLDK